jgi:hypothetical protein
MRRTYKNEFYVSYDCRENMHGTEIYIPGCKWFDLETKKRIKTSDPPNIFKAKNLHFKTKKRKFLYANHTSKRQKYKR